MPSFSFIHAADLHLGSPFQGLALKDAAIASIFVEASRKAFSTLVGLAIEKAVDFFLIAGDVYDGDWKDNKIGLFFNREMARLERAGIRVYLLRGNHDAASVITKTITLPANVHEFPTNKPGSVKLDALQVALHGQGFAERSANDNLALAYPAPVSGWFNIGVLHTSLTGREPHAPYAPCSVDDLRSRGYDYWALGHVHDYEVVASDPLVVFPGNLQGRSIRERGAKGAVLVTVDEGRVSHERLIVDEARFAQADIVVDPEDDQAAILRRVEQAVQPLADDMAGRMTALRVRLSGITPLQGTIAANRQQWRDEVEAACHRAHEDIWLEKLELRLEPLVERTVEANGTLDLGQLLTKHAGDADIVAEAERLVGEIAMRLPSGLGAAELPLDDSIDMLIEEARQLLLARGQGAG
ncbi:metallophosphoesterase family protein [Rhizobium leucaenae]|uniref:DNA repair exonuclease SbcCD nuclease subunit n=1 Tax=Rhizobium leucaenae TaxID=29450 RepID=A0A7W6ZXF7_9HYPH|nr:DNA repair exonuclease [Rhizobium leucaenae]MBB4570506.1 DNA repair exonuclease SbcCD nuclease subunit [Rhizobium leucaenae]MBB6303408.1 DNA repair exonuclease SbcCD nuclease subunit [Rhizobium leucaenae]